MSRERELFQELEKTCKLLVAANSRRDLVDTILGIELQIIEGLRIEAHPQPEEPPLKHTHD